MRGQRGRAMRARCLRPCRAWLLAALAALALAGGKTGQAASDLAPLFRPGVWSGVSGLIGFRGRIWFVNSEKFVNHNSADIYSYDPSTGKARFERSLFSQDAGDPVVAGGLLYWPFEDPRFSAGRGEFMVTNGRDWAWRVLPDGLAFHVHAMAAGGGKLFAATSAWRAGLQVSADAGSTWRVVYDHETPEGRVSRITSLAFLKGALYAGLTGDYRREVKLLRMRGREVAPAPGWPAGRRTGELAVFRDWLYAVNRRAAGGGVWRTDGRRTERVKGLDGRRVRDLEADGRAIWAITVGEGSGRLWRSSDGIRWSAEHGFDGQEPLDIVLVGGRVYVGTLKPGGGGELWGPRERLLSRPETPHPPLPPPPPPLSGASLRRALAGLDRALTDPASYRRHGVGLRRALAPFVRSGGPGAGRALSKRLAAPVPDLTVSLFGGALKATAADVARWYLLRTMALTGHGYVPPALLSVPWKVARNQAEKYLHPAPAAAWAASQLGQSEAGTLEALMGRLERGGDPPWVAGDIVSALTVLTGQGFGRDRAAWRAWWEKRKESASRR